MLAVPGPPNFALQLTMSRSCHSGLSAYADPHPL